ncbi:MAG: NAD(P)H-dependent oxidoreductase [Bifidobacterium sp.]|nr:NAD(P)H-dependent oxidoreductase [Bifidobacterium sp.]
MKASVMVFHPHLDRSRVNRALMERAMHEDGTVVRDMYAQYPDLRVDAERERALAADADLLVWQFPLYWYSAPALLKEWEDTVLDPSSDAFAGKRLLLAVSAGGRLEDYAEDGKHGATMGQVLLPYRVTAQYLGMTYERPFTIHHAHHLDEAQLAREADRYAERLH